VAPSINRRDTPCFNDLSASASVTPLGFADQQVDVFRHDNVAIDPQLETPSDALKRNFKCMLCQRVGERLSATVAAECYKMGLPRLLESVQSPGHRTCLGRESAPLKPKSGLNGPPAPTKASPITM
jgi:hypothetical protein